MVRRKARGPVTTAQILGPIRYVFQRFSNLILVLVAISLLLFSKASPTSFQGAREFSSSIFMPVLNLFSEVSRSGSWLITEIGSFTTLRAENVQLRAENEQLRAWHDAALKFGAENRSLRDLLNMKQDSELSFTTARIMADPGSTFVQSFVVSVGRIEGVDRGQPVLSSYGLVGRVVEVGEHYARILLLTDLNSRIPVLLENSRQRAILAGDGSMLPELDHLPSDAPLVTGERVVTSGHDGVFPPGIPIGVVTSTDAAHPRVQLFSDLSRLELVRIVHYSSPADVISRELPKSSKSK
jgi:rod shape-determining protein MreC